MCICVHINIKTHQQENSKTSKVVRVTPGTLYCCYQAHSGQPCIPMSNSLWGAQSAASPVSTLVCYVLWSPDMMATVRICVATLRVEHPICRNIPNNTHLVLSHPPALSLVYWTCSISGESQASLVFSNLHLFSFWGHSLSLPMLPIRGTWHTAHGLYWLRENPWLRASVGWNTSCLQSVEYNDHLYRKRRWSLYDKYAGIHIIQSLLLLHRLGGINHRLTMFTDDRHTLLLCMMVSLPMDSLM